MYMKSFHKRLQSDKELCVDAICRIGELAIAVRLEGLLAIYVDDPEITAIYDHAPFLKGVVPLLDDVKTYDSEETVDRYYSNYIKKPELTENDRLMCKIYHIGLCHILRCEKPIDIVNQLIQILEKEIQDSVDSTKH